MRRRTCAAREAHVSPVAQSSKVQRMLGSWHEHVTSRHQVGVLPAFAALIPVSSLPIPPFGSAMAPPELKCFVSPGRYVQGRDATRNLGQELRACGIESPVLLLADPVRGARAHIRALDCNRGPEALSSSCSNNKFVIWDAQTGGGWRRGQGGGRCPPCPTVFSTRSPFSLLQAQPARLLPRSSSHCSQRPGSRRLRRPDTTTRW